MKKNLKRAASWLTVASIYALPFIASESQGAFDAFYKIETIPGESTDDKHGGWIQILAFNHGVLREVDRDPDTGQRQVKGTLAKDLNIIKRVDKSSPLLFLQAVSGQPMAEHKISFVGPNSAGERKQYLQVTLSNVLVKGYSISGATEGANEKPVEEVTLAYDKIQWTYTELGADGNEYKVESEFDFAKPR